MYKKWNEEDESKLIVLREMKLDMKDAVLGQCLAISNQKLINSVDQMTKEDMDKLRKRSEESKIVEEEAKILGNYFNRF